MANNYNGWSYYYVIPNYYHDSNGCAPPTDRQPHNNQQWTGDEHTAQYGRPNSQRHGHHRSRHTVREHDNPSRFPQLQRPYTSPDHQREAQSSTFHEGGESFNMLDMREALAQEARRSQTETHIHRGPPYRRASYRSGRNRTVFCTEGDISGRAATLSSRSRSRSPLRSRSRSRSRNHSKSPRAHAQYCAPQPQPPRPSPPSPPFISSGCRTTSPPPRRTRIFISHYTSSPPLRNRPSHQSQTSPIENPTYIPHNQETSSSHDTMTNSSFRRWEDDEIDYIIDLENDTIQEIIKPKPKNS